MGVYIEHKAAINLRKRSLHPSVPFVARPRAQIQGPIRHLDQTHCVTKIKDVNDYASYRRIIDGRWAAAEELQYDLSQVEQLWVGTGVASSRMVITKLSKSGLPTQPHCKFSILAIK
jgi:hypothetical protein